MYERSYGSKYSEQEGLSTVEVAKLIRGDIKQAVKTGLLPARWKYSVRSASFAGGSSIDVRVRDCADAWVECDGWAPGSKTVHPDGSMSGRSCPNMWCAARNDPAYAHAATAHDVLSDEARAAKEALDRIHGAYNHDGSEAMVDYFDVNYYGTVDFEQDWNRR
jgi:antirestriction protein